MTMSSLDSSFAATENKYNDAKYLKLITIINISMVSFMPKTRTKTLEIQKKIQLSLNQTEPMTYTIPFEKMNNANQTYFLNK